MANKNQVPEWKKNLARLEERKRKSQQEQTEKEARNTSVWQANTRGDTRATIQHNAILDEIARKKAQAQAEYAAERNNSTVLKNYGEKDVYTFSEAAKADPSLMPPSQEPPPPPVKDFSFANVNAQPIIKMDDAKGKFWESPFFKDLISGKLSAELIDKFSAQFKPALPLPPERIIRPTVVGPQPLTAKEQLNVQYAAILGINPISRNIKLTEIDAKGHPVEPEPRYYMTQNLEGKEQPFYIETMDMVEEMKAQYANDPNANWFQKELYPWALGGLTIMGNAFTEGVGKYHITIGGGTEKEMIFQEDPNTTQAFFGLMFNAGMYVAELAKGSIESLFSNLNSMRKNEGNTSYPTAVTNQNNYEAQKQIAERITESWDDVKVWWDTFMEADAEARLPENNAYRAMYSGQDMKQFNSNLQLTKEQERQFAFDESERLTKEAEQAYRTGYLMDVTNPELQEKLQAAYAAGENPTEEEIKNEYFNKAVDLQIQAIEQRRRSDPMDAWGAATWSREPERYQMFLKNAAMLELQLGRPLSVPEIRRLKEQYANTYTELAFELVFDVTNLLPLVGNISKVAGITDAAYDVGKALMKPVYRVASLMADTSVGKGVIKAVSPAVNVYKWLTKKTVSSTANLMMQTVHDVFMRMHNAYRSIDKLIADMPLIEGLFRELKTIQDPVAAAARYYEVVESGKIMGIATLSFNDFKKLTDIDVSNMGKQTWGELFKKAIDDSREVYEKSIRRQNPNWTDDLVEQEIDRQIKRAGMPIYAFANNFSTAYKESHLIYKGSRLTDDTMAGWLLKSAREFTLDGTIGRVLGNEKWISGKLKITKLDTWIMKMGGKSPKLLKEIVGAFGSYGIEAIVGIASTARGLWTSMVLTSPRWVITNFIDSAGRSLIYGGNVFDDVLTLSNSLQAHFIDDIGFSPLAMGASLARSELGFAESIPVKLVYGDFKPKFGLFSYWAEERRRLRGLRAESIMDVQKQIAERLGKDIPENTGKFNALWNGFSTLVRDNVSAIPGAFADYNTAIEFTLRTRMLHREYFRLLSEIEPQFMNAGLENLSPVAREVAQRIWNESGGNAAKLYSLADSVTHMKDEVGDAAWSFMLPSDWGKSVRMNTESGQAFTYQIKRETASFIQSVVANTGRNPTPAEFDDFISKARVSIQDSMQSALAEANKLKGLDASLSTTGKTVEEADITTLKGAHPTFDEGAYQSALQKIEKPFFKKSGDIADAFKTIATKFGAVTEVEGDAVKVLRTGKSVTIEVGKDFGKRKITDMNLMINEATIRALSLSNLDLIKRRGLDADKFEGVLRQFLKDPALVLKTNENAFVLIADSLDQQRDLYRLLKSTGGVADYNGAYQIYQAALDNRYSMAVLHDPTIMKKSVQELADDVLMPLAERREAGQLRRINHAQFMDSAKNAGPEFHAAALRFQDEISLARTNYFDFLIMVYPGPKRIPTGEGRSAMWDLVQHLQADAYKVEMNMTNSISDLMKTDPAGAIALMESRRANFPEYFLKEQGIDIFWDDSHTDILRMTVKRDGKIQTFQKGTFVPEYVNSVFFNGTSTRNAATAIKLSVERDIPMSRQMVVALQETFKGVNYEQARTWTVAVSNHAQKWSKVTGQPVEAYFERLGFQFVNGTFEVDTKRAIGLVSNGMIQKTETGYQFFGGKATDFNTLVSESSYMFYDDLVEMAEYSDDMKDALKRINKYIRAEGGSAVRQNKLTKTQAETFSRLFTEYVASGEIPNMKLKKSFEKFKEWIIEDFKAIKQSPDVIENLPEDAYNAMNLLFVQDKLKVKSNNSTILDEVLDLLEDRPVVGLSDSGKMGTPAQRGVSAALRDRIGPEKFDPAFDEFAAFMDKKMKNAELKLPEARQEINLSQATRIEEGEAYSTPKYPSIEDIAFDNNFMMWSEEFVAKHQLSYQDFADFLQSTDPIMAKKYINQYNEAVLMEAGDTGQAIEKLVANMSVVQKKNLKKVLLDIINSDRIDLNDEAKTLLDAIDNSVDEIAINKQELIRIAKENGINIPADMRSDDIIDSIRRRIAKYNDLDEVPRSELKKAIGSLPEEVRTSFDREKMDNVDEAFGAWIQNRKYANFPDWAKQDSDTFKTYLRKRIEEEPAEVAMAYERILFDVQNMENVILSGSKAKAGVHDFMMSNGVRMYLKQTADIVGSYEETLSALDKLGDFLKEGKYLAPTLSEETVASLDEWRKVAVKSKSDLVSILLDGGEVNGRPVKGAINKVNEVMLDYTNQSNIDQFMKNFFPFWMFPSRSLPFWTKTIATHPQILAGYNKLKRFSRSQRLQAGAVTSQGRPQPSLEGYVNIPGTELWFNPLAPFSFKYVLGLSDLPEDLYYSSLNDEDIEPTAWVVRELMQTAPSAGFNLAPWTAHYMKKAFNISDSALPKFPAIPEIPLFPRWFVADILEKMNIRNFAGTPVMDMVYPEATWHDSLVERQILQDVLEQIRDPQNTESKAALLNAAREAIMQKGDNPLWTETYKALTNKEAAYANMSFFTGMYPKEFTDGQADIYALRDEKNLIKSALNNEFQSAMFDLSPDANIAWQRYLDMNNTDEGDLYRMYTVLNWVKNDAGALVTDPTERAKYLNMALQDDINQKAYYEAYDDALVYLEHELGSLPVGSSYESMEYAYAEYNKRIAEAEKLFPFKYDRAYGSNKPAELIAQDLENIYFKMLVASKPRWNEQISDEENRARAAEWEKNLPKIAKLVYNNMLEQQDVNIIRRGLKPQQVLPKDFFNNLLTNSTTDGIYQWRIKNDSVLDALNNAWTKMYWNEYWNAVSSKSGSERDLAEADFIRKRPAPTAEELYQWILGEYGPRFSQDEVYKYVNGTQPTMNIDQALLQRKGDDYMKRQQVWDYLSWLGPTKNFELVEELQFQMATNEYGAMRPDSLSLFMDTNGKAYTPEEMDMLIQSLEKVYTANGINPPPREYQVQYVEAQQENEIFRKIMNTKLSQNAEFMKLYEENWKYGFMPDGTQYVRNEDPLDVIFDVQALYFDKSGSKNSRQHQNRVAKMYPVEFAMMKEYWNERKIYGNQNPTWSTYYLWKPRPALFQDIENLSYGKGSSPAPTTETRAPVTPVDTVVELPNKMKATMGSELVKEVSKLYTQGQPLTPEGETFIRGLGQRHPEWEETIQDILYQNNRP